MSKIWGRGGGAKNIQYGIKSKSCRISEYIYMSVKIGIPQKNVSRFFNKTNSILSSPISILLKLKPELKNALAELRFEAVSVGVLPLFVQDLEGYVFVGWSRRNPS